MAQDARAEIVESGGEESMAEMERAGRVAGVPKRLKLKPHGIDTPGTLARGPTDLPAAIAASTCSARHRACSRVTSRNAPSRGSTASIRPGASLQTSTALRRPAAMSHAIRAAECTLLTSLRSQ